MRRLKKILILGLATAMVTISVDLPVYAEAENNFDLNGDGYLDAYDYNGDGVADLVDINGDGISETPLKGQENPMYSPLPLPRETVDLKYYTLTNTGAHILSYSVDGGMTWSLGTTSNPVDLSPVQYSLAPGGTIYVKYLPENGSYFLESSVQTIKLTQASVPVGTYAVDPTTSNGKGTIYGVDASMEYANALLLGAPYHAITRSSLEVDPGSYYIRVATAGSRFFSDTVRLTVNPFKSTKESKPNAVFDAASMVLSNMSSGMEYCFDGVTWTHIADGSPTSKTLTEDDAKNALAHGIQVIKKGNGSTTTDSDIQTITIHKGSTPNVVQGVAPTDTGNSGKIINVNASMQYKANGAASWIDIGSNTVTNLAPGTYLVRIRATGVTIASDSVTVNIGAFRPTVLPKEHTPGIDFNAMNMMLSDILGTKYSLDGGTNWTYAKDYNQIQLHDGQVSTDKGIKAFRPGNGTTTSDSDIQSLSIHRANTPSGISAASATSTSLGAINGLTTNMEYGPKGGSWTAATTSSVLLPAGVYYVRTRGAYTTLPSNPVEININTAATPVPVTPIVTKPTAAPTPVPVPQKTDTGSQDKDSAAEKELTQEEIDEKIKEEAAKKAEAEQSQESIPTPIPVAGEPNIVGNEGVSGWAAIEQSITAEPVVVNMNGATEVPASVLKAVKSAKSELVIGISEEIVWTIPGSAVADDVTDVNLGVVENTASIPQEAVDTVAANSIETKQFEIEYDGAFGFWATLSMRTNQDHAGKYANLFCYHGTGEPMEFIDSSQIDANGGMKFGMVHASSYVIVVSDEKYSQDAVEGTENVKVKSSEKESKTAWILLGILLFSIVIVAAAVIVVMRKRQRDLKKQHRQQHGTPHKK